MSILVLLSCTILYSCIAEALLKSVDTVIAQANWVDEKVLGLTLFAIIPSVTEFYNAIAFAQNGNIALSLEIGSAYAVQVALLQIPVLVAFSTFMELNFTLIFPRWDFHAVLFSVFILTCNVLIDGLDIYIEGKSNYFKGSMLLIAYSILLVSFLFVPVELETY